MGVRRGDGMNKLVDALSWVAMRCTQNKYLNAIKNAFQNYMPISLTGAVGMLWTNVLVNDHGGLGTVFPLIMDLKIFKNAKLDDSEKNSNTIFKLFKTKCFSVFF